MKKFLNFSIIHAVVVRHLFMWVRNLDRLVDAFWWATIDLIFWGLTSTYLKQNNTLGPNIVTAFIGGIIFWTLVQNSQREINMPLLDEAWNRNLINLFTTPIRLREFIFATIILGLLKLSLTISFLSIVAYLFYQYNIFHLGFYLIPAIINLLLVGWWVGFIVDGLIIKFGYKIEAFAWAFIFVIYPFSGVLYPISILPTWARFIGQILPTSYIFANMRNILFAGYFSLSDIILSFGLNILYIILSLLFLNKMFKSALKNGRIVRLN